MSLNMTFGHFLLSLVATSVNVQRHVGHMLEQSSVFLMGILIVVNSCYIQLGYLSSYHQQMAPFMLPHCYRTTNEMGFNSHSFSRPSVPTFLRLASEFMGSNCPSDSSISRVSRRLPSTPVSTGHDLRATPNWQQRLAHVLSEAT